MRTVIPGRAAATQLVSSCVILGAGVTLLLRAAYGSDGYSTLVSGLSTSAGVPFAVANSLVGIAFVLVAWRRGIIPGPGTIAQPVLVGVSVSIGLGLLSAPDGTVARVTLLLLALPTLCVGVAGYLGSGTGAAPAEALALSYDPPMPFRWGYSLVQFGGGLVGWALGASVGVGTFVAILMLGPVVDGLLLRAGTLDRRPVAPVH
ncbi:MAG: hypothetical protein JWM31_3098 [Solirubrobacterales bacterium]|nr:hypothetical protein [Solirubrobacterales bacterium]